MQPNTEPTEQTQNPQPQNTAAALPEQPVAGSVNNAPQSQPPTPQVPNAQPPVPQSPSGAQAPYIGQEDHGHYTLNTTSVESKVGLYTKVTFISLWVIIFSVTTALSSLVYAGGAAAQVLVFIFSALLIATPIFVIANNKRQNQLQINPTLGEDIFVKKYLRSSLFSAIALTALSLFTFVYAFLSGTLVASGSGLDGKQLVVSLIYTSGFSIMLVFCWKQHANTEK